MKLLMAIPVETTMILMTGVMLALNFIAWMMRWTRDRMQRRGS